MKILSNGKTLDICTNGATFTPAVSEDGDLSWTNNGGLPNPETVNIKGPKGEPGSGVGQSMAGRMVSPTIGTEVRASGGAEIFNDYTERTFSVDEKPYIGNIATGAFSHAEGFATTASGDYSHTEGQRVAASGTQSHAEGAYTEASGNQSHAEGYMSHASGNQSHAEGSATADVILEYTKTRDEAGVAVTAEV